MVERVAAPLFGIEPEEAGERILYDATTEQFAKGVWSIDDKGVPQTNKYLVKYREQGLAEVVAKHNQAIFEKVLKK